MKKVFLFAALVYGGISAQAPQFFDATEIKANNKSIWLADATPCAVDWNEDGKKDLLVGSFSGRIDYFENIGTDKAPVLKASVYLQAAGTDILLSAG